MPIPSQIACFGESISTTRPSSFTCPASGRTIPERMFIRVDFPAPFSPKQAVHLAAAHGERDAVVREHAGELLRDLNELDGRLLRALGCGCRGSRSSCAVMA